MDGQIHDVETYIGKIGQKCNTRLLEKKVANLEAWHMKVTASGRKVSGQYLGPKSIKLTAGRQTVPDTNLPLRWLYFGAAQMSSPESSRADYQCYGLLKS